MATDGWYLGFCDLFCENYLTNPRWRPEWYLVFSQLWSPHLLSEEFAALSTGVGWLSGWSWSQCAVDTWSSWHVDDFDDFRGSTSSRSVSPAVSPKNGGTAWRQVQHHLCFLHRHHWRFLHLMFLAREKDWSLWKPKKSYFGGFRVFFLGKMCFVWQQLLYKGWQQSCIWY